MKKLTIAAVAFLLIVGLSVDGSGIMQQAYNLIQDEGVPQGRGTTLDFTGAGVTCGPTVSGVTPCDIPGSPGGGYDRIQEEGANLTQRATLNFTGGGVTCVDDPGNSRTDCDIPASAGGLSVSGTFYLTDGMNNYGPIFPMTPPSGVSFSWRNQGGASETAVGNALYLVAPATSSTNVRGREITMPGTPWSITATFLVHNTNNNFGTCGLYLADNSSGRVVIYNIGASNTLLVGYLNSATSYNSDGSRQTGFQMGLNTYTLKIQDNGTNDLYSWSTNGGQTFQQVASLGRTAWLAAPDRVGYYCDSSNATYPAAVTLLSWVQGV